MSQADALSGQSFSRQVTVVLRDEFCVPVAVDDVMDGPLGPHLELPDGSGTRLRMAAEKALERFGYESGTFTLIKLTLHHEPDGAVLDEDDHGAHPHGDGPGEHEHIVVHATTFKFGTQQGASGFLCHLAGELKGTLESREEPWEHGTVVVARGRPGRFLVMALRATDRHVITVGAETVSLLSGQKVAKAVAVAVDVDFHPSTA